MPSITVYFNTHPTHFFGYKHGHTVCKVFSYDALTTSELYELADEAWGAFNAPLELLGSVYRSIAEDYRAAGNRSLSIGDVLCIGDTWLVCVSSGWIKLDRAPIEAEQ